MIKTIETKEAFIEATAGKLYTTDINFEIEDDFLRAAVYDAKTKKTAFYKVLKSVFPETEGNDAEIWTDGELTAAAPLIPYLSGKLYVNRIFLWENEDCFKMTFSTLKRQLHRVSSGPQHPVNFLDANFEEQEESYQDMEEDFFDMEDAPFGYYERVLVHDGNGNGYMQRRDQLGWMDNEVYVANIQQDYAFRFYKESGKAYMYKGKKFAFANYSTNEFNFPIQLETLLERVPDVFLERMNTFIMNNHISVYEREGIASRFGLENKRHAVQSVFGETVVNHFTPYSAADITGSLLYLSYYRGLQPFATKKVIPRSTGKLSSNRTINKKVKDAENKKELLKAFVPFLTNKQIAKMTFAGKYRHGHSMLYLCSLMENPDQIEKVLTKNDYSLCLNEFSSIKPSDVRKEKKLIKESIGIARFEKLIVDGLKRPNASPENPFPRDGISFVGDTLRYMRLIGAFTEEQKQKLMKAKNMRALHDELGTMVKEKKDATYAEPIEYTDKERALETDNGQFRLSLAQSKKELAEVGKEMGICVGMLYADGAFNKDFGIAIVWEEEKPVFCIELDKKFSCVVQAKARFNERVDYCSNKELSNFFYDWIVGKDLTTETYDVSEETLNIHIEMAKYQR